MRDAVEGAEALSPGHVLAVGCGTGTNVIYLATHGWRATGVDFSAAAIRNARCAADGGTGATFLEGDVTNLTQIAAPLDLMLDMGCYHSLPDDAKPTYVVELAKVITPGTRLMLREVICIKAGEIPDAFSPYFSIERTDPRNFTINQSCCATTFLVTSTCCAAADIFLPRRPVNEFHRTQWPAWLTHDGRVASAPTPPAVVAPGRVKLATPPGGKIGMSRRQNLFDTHCRLGPGLRQSML